MGGASREAALGSTSPGPASILPPTPAPPAQPSMGLGLCFQSTQLYSFPCSRLLKRQAEWLVHLSNNISPRVQKSKWPIQGTLFPPPFFLQRRDPETQNRSHLRTVKLLPPSRAAPAMCPGFPNMPPRSVPVHILPCVELKGQWLSDYHLRSAAPRSWAHGVDALLPDSLLLSP